MTEQIRNFCIIAHIDHGKSTLADRLLEVTHTISQQEMKAQVLDSMDLEQERGITIKLHAVRMAYQGTDGQTYSLNLIDTPGHVDFTYEVSRSLAACEGAILVVDASQGVEAQTISNLYLAINNNLTIIPVVNKIDLPGAEIDKTKMQILELLGCKEDEILLASAKSGIGIQEILEAVVHRIPPPTGIAGGPLRALVFDSMFDSYRGAVAYIRVVDGVVKKGMKIKFFFSQKVFDVDEVGFLRLGRFPTEELSVGMVGYVIPGAKEVKDTKVGDTITDAIHPASDPLPGYKEVKPMVFSGLYPVDTDQYEDLRDSLQKLTLNDSSLLYEPETSTALGFGFRCGFLGLLHMEIIQERLEREYNLNIINTVPNVEYKVFTTNGEVVLVDNPTFLPSPQLIDHIEEPFISAQIITPTDYIGNIMKLSQDRRGVYQTTTYLDPTRADLRYQFPLSEIVFDFYDKLKSLTKGYASLDYEFFGYRESDLVKLDILINGEPLDALSTIVFREKSYPWGRALCSKLKELIPRQMFDVVIQAAIGGKIIARDQISAMRKNVLAKCYGGDITRKRKLLEKQKEGKRRMKSVGQVEIPQEAFLAVLKIDT